MGVFDASSAMFPCDDRRDCMHDVVAWRPIRCLSMVPFDRVSRIDLGDHPWRSRFDSDPTAFPNKTSPSSDSSWWFYALAPSLDDWDYSFCSVEDCFVSVYGFDLEEQVFEVSTSSLRQRSAFVVDSSAVFHRCKDRDWSSDVRVRRSNTFVPFPVRTTSCPILRPSVADRQWISACSVAQVSLAVVRLDHWSIEFHFSTHRWRSFVRWFPPLANRVSREWSN